jgi:hypothetical protein
LSGSMSFVAGGQGEAGIEACREAQ